MTSTKLIKLAITGFSLALAIGACSSSNDNSPGTGGSSGTGHGGAGGGAAGATGAGGTSSGGSGGSSAGNAGTGGASAGGSGGQGGSAGSNAGTAGATGAGGSGGSSGSGGANGGSGGGVGSGGANGGSGGSGGSAGGHGGGAGGATGGGGGSTGSGGSGGGSGTFKLTSPMLMDGAKFDGKYTCNGGNLGAGVNPELDWTGVPAGTKAFAITFIDTTLGANMATGQHWAMWNIPWDASTGKVSSFPEGTTTLTGDLAGALQTNKFLAPCAQSLTGGMDDKYEFTIYALSNTLNITGASGSGVANSAGVAKVLQALESAQPLGMAVLHAHAGLKGQ